MSGVDERFRIRSVARWAVTFVEPLLPVDARVGAEQGMLDLAAGDPQWTTALLGAVCADMALSLPPDDAFRHVSSRVGTLTAGPGQPPETTGSVLDGKRFGTWQNFTDQETPTLDPLDADVMFAAVAEPLGDVAAGLAGFAFAGWDASIGAHRAAAADIGHADWWAQGTSLLKWLTVRRRNRSVIGRDDDWIVRSIYRWGMKLAADWDTPPGPDRADLAATVAREVVEDDGRPDPDEF